MTYTSHGHYIPGTPHVDRPAGQRVGRCGGVHVCPECSAEYIAANPNVANLHLTTATESGISNQDIALARVKDWAINSLGVNPHAGFYIVWFCNVFGGWKTLISTTEADGRYYEITYNLYQNEAYIDTYKKTHNVTIDMP